jgi:hypothetical protein
MDTVYKVNTLVKVKSGEEAYKAYVDTCEKEAPLLRRIIKDTYMHDYKYKFNKYFYISYLTSDDTFKYVLNGHESTRWCKDEFEICTQEEVQKLKDMAIINLTKDLQKLQDSEIDVEVLLKYNKKLAI